ncbi:MAG: peptidoglycan editing factor PgeF [Eubacterium sp.]|nr:peptidoglycan editing factor PgeF [Eubacterium sp.]
MDIETARSIVDMNYSDLMNGYNRTLNVDGEAPFVQVKGFTELNGIKHGFTTRLGGVSEGIYESLNMGIHLDDDVEKVMENYRRIGESMGIDYTRISCPNQLHNDNILVVKEEDAGDGITRPLTHENVDAQITNVKNLPLIVYAADCVPILLADPISRVIGSVHAGWRGTVAGIAAKTVLKMVEEFGCLPENIHAVIGPSISADNYEVDENVIKQVYRCNFVDMSDDNVSYTEIEKSNDVWVNCKSGSYTDGGREIPYTYKGVIQPLPGASYDIFRTVKFRKRYMLNLWSLNEVILANAGLKLSHIYNTRLCTMKNHDLFFSHRYTKGRRGLNAGIISLS